MARDGREMLAKNGICWRALSTSARRRRRPTMPLVAYLRMASYSVVARSASIPFPGRQRPFYGCWLDGSSKWRRRRLQPPHADVASRNCAVIAHRFIEIDGMPRIIFSRLDYSRWRLQGTGIRSSHAINESGHGRYRDFYFIATTPAIKKMYQWYIASRAEWPLDDILGGTDTARRLFGNICACADFGDFGGIR